MVPSIIFGQYGWNFIFVDPTSKEFVKDEDITKNWLKREKISETEFVNTCWNEYYSLKDAGVKCGLISYSTSDDEKIFNLSQQLDLNETYEKVFDF
jgi:hypothetical protein